MLRCARHQLPGAPSSLLSVLLPRERVALSEEATSTCPLAVLALASALARTIVAIFQNFCMMSGQNTHRQKDAGADNALRLIADAQDSHVLYTIFGFLPPKDLARASCVNKLFMRTGQASSLWNPLCRVLWEDKVYVPRAFRYLAEDGDAYRAYWLSLRDSERQHLTDEELTNFEWSRRM